MTSLTGRAIVQKENAYKSKKLTELAQFVPCRFTFPHKCSDTTMACHANWLIFGKAVGMKTADWIWASGCLDAHNAIDDKLDKRLTGEQREYEWMNAFLSTWNFIYENKLVRVA